MKFINPALTQESRYEPAQVIPLKRDGSLIDWLEGNGRLIYRESQEPELEFDSDLDIEALTDDDSDDFSGFEDMDSGDDVEPVDDDSII
jgi:hypothetical protein